MECQSRGRETSWGLSLVVPKRHLMTVRKLEWETPQNRLGFFFWQMYQKSDYLLSKLSTKATAAGCRWATPWYISSFHRPTWAFLWVQEPSLSSQRSPENKLQGVPQAGETVGPGLQTTAARSQKIWPSWRMTEAGRNRGQTASNSDPYLV